MFSGLFSIPRHAPFLDALAHGMRQAAAQNPLALADTVVLVPNRRSVRVLRELFLNQSVNDLGEGASVLPRLLTFGDLADDDATLSLDTFLEGEPLLPPVSGAERLLHLTRFVQQQDKTLNPVQAVALARDLGNLFNELALFEADLSKLPELVDRADLAQHWGHTLKFTSIITALWPEYLRQIGRSDPALHRATVLRRLADAWAAAPPTFPVIMAGVQRAEPVLMYLADAVLKNKQGAVVLPGFDANMAEDVWANLDIVHPDRLLRDVVTQLGPTRTAVQAWPHVPAPSDAQQARANFINLAMLPAAYTRTWEKQAQAQLSASSLQGITQITADDEASEATVVSLIIRYALETPSQTVSLLTADRTLARRVAALLQRWEIVADDSSGLPFLVSRLCIFLQLVAAATSSTATSVELLALLKHPLCNALDVDTDALEKEALRGHYPASGFAGLMQHLRREKHAALADTLDDACGAFAALLDKNHADGEELLRAHLKAAENLATADKLWFGAEGEAASGCISQLLDGMPSGTMLESRDYLPWLMQLLATTSVRVPYGQHPRVTIHGLIEARLQQVDVMIVAGLNEGVWPALPAANPWLNRKMREGMGLPSPDEVIAQQAHDFVSALSAPTVYLTRAARRDGAPTVPARWWHRLCAVLTPNDLHKVLDARAHDWLAWAKALDAAENVQQPAAPAPCPPVAARPRKLSVTTIEMWMRNPYGLYAKEVLRLRKLDELKSTPGYSERGQFVHDALADFTPKVAGRALAPADWQAFEESGRAALQPYAHLPGITAFWWPRFTDAARWWWTQEQAHRPVRLPQVVEERGEHTFDWAGGVFTLHGKPDRIDVQGDTAIVLDYKTGGVPSPKNVDAGIAPQLSLEAVLVQHGAFKNVKAQTISAEYWKLGATATRCEIKPVKNFDPAAAEAGLKALVEAFNDATVPYHPTPIAARRPEYNDYDHLARTSEWAVVDEEGEAA